jgi:hypothetical protein
MALSNQSELLPAFFSPWQVNLKISHRILPNPTIPEDDLPEIGLIPVDDIPGTVPRMVKSRKMTCRNWPNPGLRQAGISKEDLLKPAA